MLKNSIKRMMQKFFIGTCDVIVREPYTDSATHKTAFTEKIVHVGIPCRLSFDSHPVVSEGIVASQATKTTLFCFPMDIPAGSKLVVTQRGIMTAYKCTGVPKLYESHMEIDLELFDKWA